MPTYDHTSPSEFFFGRTFDLVSGEKCLCACTHTSKYIITNAQKVSEVTMTSPNHAFQYCHDYVFGRTCFAAQAEASLWQASARAVFYL